MQMKEGRSFNVFIVKHSNVGPVCRVTQVPQASVVPQARMAPRAPLGAVATPAALGFPDLKATLAHPARRDPPVPRVPR